MPFTLRAPHGSLRVGPYVAALLADCVYTAADAGATVSFRVLTRDAFWSAQIPTEIRFEAGPRTFRWPVLSVDLENGVAKVGT